MKYKSRHFKTSDRTKYYFLKPKDCYCYELKEDVVCMWCGLKIKKIAEHLDIDFVDENDIQMTTQKTWDNLECEAIQI